MIKQFLLLLSIAHTLQVYSQTDSSLNAGIDKSKMAVDAGDPIYVGPEHVGYRAANVGIAYYVSADWQKGTIVFQQVLYKDVYLKYDLVQDEVVIRHLDGGSRITLFTPRIQSFTLGDKHFIQLSANEEIKAGFYEELSKGKLSLYAKHVKHLEETVGLTSVERKFIGKPQYYLLKNGQYIAVKNDKALLDLLPQQKREIKEGLKASGIKFKQNPEATLKKIVDHYNQLSR